MKTPHTLLSLTLLVLMGCGADFPGLTTPLALNVKVSDISATEFCCDPGKPFPQAIGTVTITNNHDVDVDITIRPFTNGVVADTGPSARLMRGATINITLQAVDCGWTTSEGAIWIDDPRLDGPAGRIVKDYTLTNTCPFADRITTGLEVSGLARAHFDTQNDPSPYGMDPVLYVIGPSNNAGVEAYAIKTGLTGKITGAPKVKTVGIPVPIPLPMMEARDDIVPVSEGMGAGLARALYLFAPTGFARTHWNSAGMDWGGLQIFGALKDMVSYSGSSRSKGVSFAQGEYARFHEFNGTQFVTPTPTGQLGGEFHFPNHTGDPVSVFVDDFSGGALIVMEGSPGQVWFHDRMDTVQKATLVGATGNDPRQVRASNGLAAVSNYASNNVTVMRWIGPFAPLGTGPITPGPTVLPNPLKIDMIALRSGTTALAVASDTTDRWWVGELDGNGNVVNSWEGAFGRGGGLADIVFLPGDPTYVAIALKGFPVVRLIELPLNAPPQ